MGTDSNNPTQILSTKINAQPRRLLIPRSQRRRFLLQFTLMTVLGWVVGGVASIALETIILENLSSEISSPSPSWWVKLLSNLVFAVVFGADQALALRRYLSPWLWALATSAGWLIANGVATVWINYISSIATSFNEDLSPEVTIFFGFLSTISYIVSGIWLGFMQWLALRRYTTGSGWWNFLPSISFFGISLLIWLLTLVQDFMPAVNRTQIIYLSEQAFTAIILGVIPAIGLCTLKINLHRQAGISRSSSNH